MVWAICEMQTAQDSNLLYLPDCVLQGRSFSVILVRWAKDEIQLCISVQNVCCGLEKALQALPSSEAVAWQRGTESGSKLKTR